MRPTIRTHFHTTTKAAQNQRCRVIWAAFLGANGRTRTGDLLITNELLYQLSYIGDRLASASGHGGEKVRCGAPGDQACRRRPRVLTASLRHQGPASEFALPFSLKRARYRQLRLHWTTARAIALSPPPHSSFLHVGDR
jgi:hypothetical protein